MRKITRVTVEREDGTTETWRGSGSVHEYFTGPRATPPAHTSSYIHVVLVPERWSKKPVQMAEPPKAVMEPPPEDIETVVSHAEGIGDA